MSLIASSHCVEAVRQAPQAYTRQHNPDHKTKQPSTRTALFKPTRVPFLPVPAIPYHLVDPILRTPAKLTLSLRRVRVNDRNVAGTAAINDIRNLDAIHTFKSFYELQNAVALPCSQVISNQALSSLAI